MTQPTNPQIRVYALLAAACVFLFFYGLGAFGLIGADEPRYAQVAREMLSRHDWVTPTLQGQPWLEKPVLYYWQAMLSFRMAGVSDEAARIPSAIDAAILVAAIYFFLRRFRRGSELDGGLIAASSAGVIGFARAAATDMPLAATFSIALLCWYAWYEGYASGSSKGRIYLGGCYFFLALGTLAKGPVAPGLAAVIIFIFIALKRDWRAISASLWIPGIALYLAVMLPWYVAAQLRNPQFFRFFILEHNLARFSRDVYHHRQPFWFYVPVFLLAMMPWTFVLIVAVVERVRTLWSDGTKALSTADDSWQLFLLIWMIVPVAFFSASQSKLPGYILPAVPAGALLVAEYLAVRRRRGGIVESDIGEGQGSERRSALIRKSYDAKLRPLLSIAHGVLCGLLIFAAFCAASIMMQRRLPSGTFAYIGAVVAAVAAIGVSAALSSRVGVRLFTRVTLVAVVISVAVMIRVAAPVIDATQSARSVAERIQLFSQVFSQEPVPVAIYRINRMQEYGLEFYLDRAMQMYEAGHIPASAHVLVAAQNTQVEVAQLVPGRRVSYLTSIPAQKLDLYWVGKEVGKE
jgi:4-amino-4-deoxy-L-arabinose transferase-like glycosyltransferase